MRGREAMRFNAEALGMRFFRCPTTGRVIDALPGDDKALCRCGRSNPAVPAERTHLTGVHIVRFLRAATTDEFLDQKERDWKVREEAR